MSEAGAGQNRDEQEWQRGSWILRMRRLQHESPEQYLPQMGVEVAGYRLETRLGTGEKSRASPGDDAWALGVEFYQLGRCNGWIADGPSVTPLIP